MARAEPAMDSVFTKGVCSLSQHLTVEC